MSIFDSFNPSAHWFSREQVTNNQFRNGKLLENVIAYILVEFENFQELTPDYEETTSGFFKRFKL